MEKITQLEAWCELMELFVQNASDETIANLAFDFYNRWADTNSKESYNIIYDIALIGEPGMELTHEKIGELIGKLEDIDTLIINESKNITQNFDSFSNFIEKIEEDDYLKSKYPDFYQNLVDIYFLVLGSCDLENKSADEARKDYQSTAFLSVKKFFLISTCLLKKYVH